MLKWFLGRFGFELRRKPEKSPFETAEMINDVTVKIAGFDFVINSNNPLHNWYTKFPDYNAELVRVAEAVFKKYPEMGVIDIGANVGDTLALIKRKLDVKFVCVEGDPFIYKYLKRNSVQFNNTVTLNFFLGDQNGEAVFITEKEGWNTTLIPVQDSAGLKISIVTFDKIMGNIHNILDYKLFKTDAEGFDTKIIRGALGFIRKVKPVICMEYNRENMDKISENGLLTLNLLADIGYETILIYESMGRFILSASLSDKKLIKQLHEYIEGKKAAISYFDFCLFHKCDDDIAASFVALEEKMRLHG